MNLRCIYCQTPFTLSRPEMLSAIMLMNEKGMNHYDGHCPRCRRANSISRQRMELFFPNWQEAAKKQTAANEVAASAFLKTEPLSKASKAAKAAAKPAAAKAKAPTVKKPAAKKAATTKKK